MFIEAILISIIIGFLRGGKLRRFKFVNYKTIWVLILGMLIQYILIFLNRIDEVSSINKILLYTKPLLIFSYILILIGIVANIKFKSLWVALIGFMMNFLVIITNGWKKPILLKGIELTNTPGLKEIIEMGNSEIYVPIGKNTKHPMLGDIIVFSNPYPISRIISLGDLVISLGIFTMIQEIMLGEDSVMGGYRF